MMNILKFLAFLRGYITYIFQVRVKHYLSTDIVLITQNLRKKIRQGKTYFTGTAILLKKRCTIGVQNEIKTADSSGSLRVWFEYPSALRRTNVAPSSGVLRLLFGCSSGRTRSAAEALPKPSRSVAEHVSNMSRRSPEAEPKVTRRGVGALLSSDFFLTNFASTSAFHAMGHEFSSAVPLIFPEGDPKPARRNSEQRWEKGRSWSGIGRYLNGLFLGTNGTVSSPLSYRECTERVPKRYWKGTKELPKIYQRGTEQIRAVCSSLADLGYKSDSATTQAAKGEGAGLHNGRDGSCFKFDAFKTFYERIDSNISSFIIDGISRAHRALKYLGCLFDNKNTSRMSLTCFALVFQSSNYSFKVLKSIRALALSALMVSMFSLSAQTPRKDSGADGPVKAEPLLVGQKLPEEFWKREYLVYNNGDTTRQTLEAYRGKLLVLDFWATWCAICLGQMKEKDELFSRFPADAKLIYVNPTQTKDTYTNIAKIQDRLAKRSLSGKFQSIIEEDYLQQLFPNYIYPRYVWIGPRGDLIGLTLALSVKDGHIKDMLNLINPKDGKK